jgi:hypothetical protein
LISLITILNKAKKPWHESLAPAYPIQLIVTSSNPHILPLYLDQKERNQLKRFAIPFGTLQAPSGVELVGLLLYPGRKKRGVSVSQQGDSITRCDNAEDATYGALAGAGRALARSTAAASVVGTWVCTRQRC